MAPPVTTPAWSIANTCHTGLAPSPGSANAPARANGTVLAWIRPAGLTTVPTSPTTPSAASCAMAAMAAILLDYALAYSVILQL